MSKSGTAVFDPRESDGSARAAWTSADHLASGGDIRLVLDPDTRLNRYGCSVTCRPSVNSFSSSTASSVSQRGLARAEAAYAAWKRAARVKGDWEALDGQVDELRRDLSNLLGLDGSEVDLVFSPSGTDSQLHALALLRAELKAPLRTLVVASDETGSGTVWTAAGRHFSDRTAAACEVRTGRRLDGFDDIDEPVLIPANGPDGPRPIAEVDADVLSAVRDAASSGRKVVVQAMNASKFGRRLPSDDCLASIRRHWAGTARIVVDACQLRLGRRRLHRHLALGDMVLITGSKFFTGPSFSGAVLIPRRFREASPVDRLPPGMVAYTSRHDWPPAYADLRRRLPGRAALGPWLRWEAAAAEMSAYFSVPAAFRRRALETFATAAEDRRDTGCCDSTSLIGPVAPDDDDEEFAVPTIFPFLVRTGAGFASPGQAASLYRDMNRDAADLLPAGADPAARDLLAALHQIGQPVPLTVGGRPAAALRVSADSRFVVACWSSDPAASDARLERHLGRLRQAFDKLALLQSACRL